MTITATRRPRTLGPLQAEALITAAHGPIGACKSLRTQAAALVKKGLLSPEGDLTEEGRQEYAARMEPVSYAEGRERLRKMGVWGSARVAGISQSGETVFLAGYAFRDAPAVAVRASTVPEGLLQEVGLG